MARSKTSKAWMHEHVTDVYVQRAKAQGYRSRAAFKLLEIDARDRLLRPGQTVIDLGAAPGGWSQVAAAKVGRGGRVIAVDLLPMDPVAGVTFLQQDFTTDEGLAAVEAALGGAQADVVLSDMAPNISGISVADQARSIHLCELAVDFAVNHLRPEGVLLMKAFQGAGFPELLAGLRRRFRSVASRKPDASRGRSSEMYLLARGPRQSA
ncbi:MAG: RlmE family RNA methyltransferase [Burkholderiales bacterium]|nr:RlmE family RNA methyltransferase [Burkholderiales bacterium]PZN05669.1 MAG: 23S rRNA methyltransferase [Pseudomonadota bacterium]